MSEKRFKLKETLEDVLIEDLITQSKYSIYGIVDLLNEQQATIEQLRQSQDVKEFSALFNQSIALQREIKDLKEENEKLTKMLNANYKTNNELVQYIQMLERDNDE